MPFKSKKRFTRRSKKPAVGRKLQQTRALVGQSKTTQIERLARNGGMTGALAKVVSQMSGLINTEAKYHDVSATNALMTSLTVGTLTIQPLSNIASGALVGERVGEKMLYKSLSLSGTIRAQVATDVPIYRVLVFIDKKPAIGTPTGADLYESSINPFSPINKDNGDRFVILKKWVITPPSAGNFTQFNFKLFTNLKGIHQEFIGTASNTQEKNKIYIALDSDNASSIPRYYLYSRVKYYDN